MSTGFIVGLSVVYGVLVVVDFVIYIVGPSWREDWSFVFDPTYTLTSFLMAVAQRIDHHTWLSLLYLFYSGLALWLWWHNDKNKRKRRKMLDRAASRVKDMGGRLKVIKPATA